MMFYAVAAILVSVVSLASSWEFAGEQRLLGELRVVNEGIAHDDTHWILSNQKILYRTTVQPIRITEANYHAIPEELLHASYNHIGDIDVYEDIIYGGIEAKNGNAALAKWHASNLTLISYKITEQKGLPWVAVDPSSELLYSALWNDCCQLQVYDLHTFEHISSLAIPSGMPNEVQGGAFYNGLLYLTSNTNVSVWSIDISTGEKNFILSDDYIESHIYEMEGLDFWNLEEYGLGSMHLYGNFMEVKEKGIRHYKDV